MGGSQEYKLKKKTMKERRKLKERARTLIWESYMSQNGGQR
jgi:hypothetical protein